MREAIEKELHELIHKAGYPMSMGSKYCKAHTQEHGSCIGCESEQGCRKKAEILCLLIRLMGGSLRNEDEFIRVIQCLNDHVMDILGVSDHKY